MKQFERRIFLKYSLQLSTLAAITPTINCYSASKIGKNIITTKPNIILIYSDDQPLKNVGCYGGKVLSPHIDSLARNGIMFNNFYISSAVCSPSRFSILTGKYASRAKSIQRKFPTGGPVNIGWESHVYGEKYTIGHILQAAGYRTGMVGKWMQGQKRLKRFKADVDPNDPETKEIMQRNYDNLIQSVKSCGFDYAASAYTTNVGYPYRDDDGYLPKPMRHHNMEWVTKGTLDFIEQNKNKPFFLYMPTTLIHSPHPKLSIKSDPRYTPAGILDKAPDVQPSRTSVLERVKKAGLNENSVGVTWLDDGVGAVLKKLDQLDIADNTIVIFASDNGVRGKFSCYDAGARMPFIIRWPAVIKKASTCNKLVSNVDIVPTLLEICGVKPPQDLLLDGQSFSAILTGKKYKRDSLFLEITTERAVVTDDGLKYIAVRYLPEIQEKVNKGEKFSHWCKPTDSEGRMEHTYKAEKHYPAYFDQDQLYDLNTDPHEQHNLAGLPQYQKKLKKMKKFLKQYCENLPHTFGEFKK
ncbi:MAG: sulfatase family protein [Planctomycetota bacterium]|jgi:arylsulfatase A-like enzyme